MTANRKEYFLDELVAVQAKCDQLPYLRKAVPSGFFERIRSKIELEAEQPSPLKLPVLFFLLKRRDLPSLQSFDNALAHLAWSALKRDLNNLLARLCEENDYRTAAAAVLEIEVLTKLLDQEQVAVAPYPPIPGTSGKAEASLTLTRTTAYIEVTGRSQAKAQEEVWDLARSSSYRNVSLSDSEKKRLRVSSVQGGVAAGVGDPYGDASRVLDRLEEKRRQLSPHNPNIICLGFSDLNPNILSIGWAIEDIFSGSPTAEPRLSGVLVFRWNGTGFSPQQAFRNPSVGPQNALMDSEWEGICRILGFKA